MPFLVGFLIHYDIRIDIVKLMKAKTLGITNTETGNKITQKGFKKVGGIYVVLTIISALSSIHEGGAAYKCEHQSSLTHPMKTI